MFSVPQALGGPEPLVPIATPLGLGLGRQLPGPALVRNLLLKKAVCVILDSFQNLNEPLYLRKRWSVPPPTHVTTIAPSPII